MPVTFGRNLRSPSTGIVGHLERNTHLSSPPRSPPAVTPSLRAQVGDFEVAITGGIWVAAGAVTIPDPDHSIGQERLLTMGQSTVVQLLVVSHTEEGDTIHIISARRATTHERKDYEE